MRSPVLIAETPFAKGHGPRFLAPPGRGVDSAAAGHYIGRVRDEADDVEEVEGDDYLAVRMSLDDEATGETAPQILVLAGIDVNRMTGEERDEVLEQLRERLEVLDDAVAAVDWSVHGHELVVEIPELEEWHESGWDVLPRCGPWAEEASTAHFRGIDTQPLPQPEPQSIDDSPTKNWDELARPDPEPESDSRSEERIEDAGEPFHAGHRDEPAPEPTAAAATPSPEPPLPEPEEQLKIDEPTPAPPLRTWSAPLPEPTAAAPPPEPPIPTPVPDVIVKVTAAPAPVEPPIQIPLSTTKIESTHRAIDPIQVSESVDRSPALAPMPPRPADTPRARPLAFRWWVWGPWTAVAVLLTAKYLYLTQVDKTWNQRISETHFSAGPTKVVEVPVETVGARPAPVLGAPGSKQDQWDRYEMEFRARLGRNDFVGGADLLHTWKTHLPTWDAEPPDLKKLCDEFRKATDAKLNEWVLGVANEARFHYAYDAVASFASAASVKALIPAADLTDRVNKARSAIRNVEDQYHYSRIRSLLDDPAQEPQLKQHIDLYLALVEPPGRMLAEVQQLADYRRWLKDGQPAKAMVKVAWGPRAAAERHTIEIGLGAAKDGVSRKTMTRAVDVRPGTEWVESFPISGIAGPPGRIPCQVRMVRPTSAIEELAEAVRERTESFVPDGPGPMTGVDTGTVVTVEWQGILERPAMPAWKDGKAPVLPVSLPKVGP